MFGDLDDAEGNSMPKVQHGPSARPEDFESDDDDDDGDDDDNDNGDTFGTLFSALCSILRNRGVSRVS